MTEQPQDGIRIRVLDGPNGAAAQEYFFDSFKDTITFGRDARRCDVQFADALRMVGNEHFALKRALGRYELQLNLDNRLLVDGKPAYEGQLLSEGARGQQRIWLVQLGSNGPRVEIEVIDTRPETLLSDPVRVQHGQLIGRHRNALRLGGLALVGLAAFAGWFFYDIRTSVEPLTARMAESASVPQSAIAALERAVYLVVVRDAQGKEDGQGTAWVAEGGYVVTNAHVAELFDRREEGVDVLIRASHEPYRDHVVTGIRKHPGYDRYRALHQQYLPFRRGIAGDERVGEIAPADVAILEVTDADALSEGLKLADTTTLESLTAGEPVAYAGYPTENLLGGSLQTPLPVVQKNVITRITDFFMVKRSDGLNQLVQHGLPVTGGASGSPIINRSGEVVAVVSSGNFYLLESARIPNAASINFAQRADLVADLLHRVEVERTELYAREWENSLKLFARESDLVLERIAAEFAALGEPTVTETTGTVSRATPYQDYPSATIEHRITAPGMRLFLAAPEGAGDLDMLLLHDGEVLKLDDDSLPYAILLYQAYAPTTLSITVLNYTQEPEGQEIGFRLRALAWAGEPAEIAEKLGLSD